MYHMIHATDHEAAPALMGRAYKHAVAAPIGEQLALVDLSGKISRSKVRKAKEARRGWE